MIRIFIFSLLFFSLAKEVAAQEVVFSRPEKLSSKIEEFELIGKTNEGVLFMKWGEQIKEVEALDQSTLKTLWKKQLNIQGKNFDVIDPVLNFLNEVVLIYTIRQNGTLFLYGQRYDAEMNPIEGAKLLDSSKKKLGSKNFQYELIYNTDRSKLAIIKKFNDLNSFDKVEVTVYNRLLKELSKNEVVFNEQEWYKETVITMSGAVLILTGQIKRLVWSSESRFESLIVHPISDEGKPLPKVLVGNEAYWINDFETAIDNVNDKLIIGGFYAIRDQRFSKGHFYASLNLENFKVESVQYEPFSQEMIDKNAAALGWGNSFNNSVRSEYLNVTHVLAKSDGGAVIVGENSFSTERQSTVGSSRFNTPVGRISDQLVVGYSFNDIFVVNVQKGGALDWSKILVKNQYSEEDGGFYSSFAMYNGRNDLRFIFNEEIKFNTNITNFTLGPRGETNVKGLFNSATYQVKLAPRYASQISRNEMIVPCYNQRMEFLLAKIAY